ncbi:MAG: DUF2889 domain-containing protein [Pseudomonadota bacterium]
MLLHKSTFSHCPGDPPLTLPSAQPRKQLHTRAVTYRGYQRDDGLWDIEGHLLDTRTYESDALEKGVLPPGTPVHDMSIRVTVDDKMVIQDIASSMSSVPFSECNSAQDPIRNLIGAKLGPGWRLALETKLGGIKGCTHMRELLFNIATAAYQTVPVYLSQVLGRSGQPIPAESKPPFHMGKCKSWDFNGGIVKRHYPQFVGWKKPPPIQSGD